jgi:hypothetical protein
MTQLSACHDSFRSPSVKTARFAIFCLPILFAADAAADTKLRPTQPIDQQKLSQAKQLEANFRAGKLSRSDAQQFQSAVTRGKNAAAAAAASSLAGGGTAGSCVCTATCQTIVFANGTEYQWTGTGTVSSPSACADAAEDFCGSAYSTWLHHWNCK